MAGRSDGRRARSRRPLPLLLFISSFGIGVVGARRVGLGGGEELQAAARTASRQGGAGSGDGCHCPGEVLEGEDVVAAIDPRDGLFRIRKAAQRLCDDVLARGELGDVPTAAAVFYACKIDGGSVGYCCKPMAEHEAKKRAPEALEAKDLALYGEVNAGYLRLQDALEVASANEAAPEELAGAAFLLAEQRALVERKEFSCRSDMDDLDHCGDPLYFLVSLRHLYLDLGASVDRLSEAATACMTPRQRLLGAATRAGRAAIGALAQRAAPHASRLVSEGRKVAVTMWRNRMWLLAGVIAAQGAQPCIKELLSAGISEDVAVPVAESFARIVDALKGIACRLVHEPMLLAGLVTIFARILGTTLLQALPGDAAAASPPSPAQQGGLDLQRLRQRAPLRRPKVRKAGPPSFVEQARGLAETLRSSDSVPVASEMIVLLASDFFEGVAGCICAAMGQGMAAAAPARPPPAEQAAAVVVPPEPSRRVEAEVADALPGPITQETLDVWSATAAFAAFMPDAMDDVAAEAEFARALARYREIVHDFTIDELLPVRIRLQHVKQLLEHAMKPPAERFSRPTGDAEEPTDGEAAKTASNPFMHMAEEQEEEDAAIPWEEDPLLTYANMNMDGCFNGWFTGTNFVDLGSNGRLQEAQIFKDFFKPQNLQAMLSAAPRWPQWEWLDDGSKRRVAENDKAAEEKETEEPVVIHVTPGDYPEMGAQEPEPEEPEKRQMPAASPPAAPALLEVGAGQGAASAPSSYAPLGQALLQVARKMQGVQAQLEELRPLEAALSSARVWWPLLTLLTWSGEHLLPMLARLGRPSSEALKSREQEAGQSTLSMTELKDYSKEARAQIQRLAETAMRKCTSTQKDADAQEKEEEEQQPELEDEAEFDDADDKKNK